MAHTISWKLELESESYYLDTGSNTIYYCYFPKVQLENSYDLAHLVDLSTDKEIICNKVLNNTTLMDVETYEPALSPLCKTCIEELIKTHQKILEFKMSLHYIAKDFKELANKSFIDTYQDNATQT